MSNPEAVKSWRIRAKDRLIKAFGSKCAVCSYDKCPSALQFHHLDPSEKETTISTMMSTIKSWDKIVAEAKKCIMVCGNCHAEIHAGVTVLPENYPTFDEAFSDYRKNEHGEQDACGVCGTSKPSNQQTCSRKCAGSKSTKFDWSKYDLPTLIKNRSVLSVAKELGISDSALSKRLKKLGLK